MIYIFKLRDGELIINNKYYSTYLDIDWFITNLIKYTDNDNNSKTIEVYESKNAVLTLFDSIRFNKLVMYNESIDYILTLADYWCAPEWLIEELKEYKKNKLDYLSKKQDEIKMNEKTLMCNRCYTGYKESENTNTSCKTHRYSVSLMGGNDYIFTCCGKTHNEQPCIIGYHYSDE